MRLAVDGDRNRHAGDLLLLHYRLDGGVDDDLDAVVSHALAGTEEQGQGAVACEFVQVFIRHD
ncbi:hypothetical protein D3C85_1793460 [compost metagenome]